MNGMATTQKTLEDAIARSDWHVAAPILRGLASAGQADAGLLTQLSYIESFLGHYRAARDAALASADKPPSTVEVAEDVLARLRTFNEVGALDAYLARLGPRSRLPIPLLLAAASRLSSLNLQAQALAMLDEAKRGDPFYPPTLIARGQVLMYLGRLSEAKAELDQALSRAPHVPQLHWLLAHVARADPDKNHVAAIHEQLGKVRPPADVALLQSALHKELDDIGEVDSAWEALERACGAKRGTLQYDIADSRKLIDELIAMPVVARGAEVKAQTGQTGKMPIFIVGMHRSGTTLLEQLLDANPQVLGVGELYDFTSAMRHATDHHCKGVIDRTIVERAATADFAEVGRRYLGGLAWRLGGQSHFTDKLPSNFLNIGFICQALPQARILHMVRDPVETCFSNLRELFSEANPYSYDQGELADYFIQYRRLMAHWHALFPGQILDVDYARLTSETAVVMREVAEFCGLEYTDAMCDPRSSSRAVATASAVQVREGVVRRDRPKWAPYARQLEPLILALRQGGIEILELAA